MATYTNISIPTTLRAHDYVDRTCTSGVKQHVLARAAHLGLAPASLVTQSLDLAIGIFSGFGAIFTCGKKKSVNEFMIKHLGSGSMFLVSMPYIHLLKVFNPGFKATASLGGHLLPHAIADIIPTAIDCSLSDNKFKRHVTSRLCFLLMAVASIITSVVELVIGVIAATLSLLAIGRWKWMNNVAIKALSAPGTYMTVMSIIGMITPHANKSVSL